MSSPVRPIISGDIGSSRQEYHIEKQIGRGSFGDVYRAIDSVNLQIVAVKRVPNRHVGRDVFPEREYRILRDSRHSNIISVLAYLKDTNNSYLILEYAEKGDLLEFMNKRGGVLTERDSFRLLYQLTSAVKHMHSLLYVHLDIKLENILIFDERTDNFEVKLTDFGFAKSYDPLQRVIYGCGSMHYASPELVFEQPIFGPEADMWSIGCSVYAAATKRMVINGKDVRIAMNKIKITGVDIFHTNLSPCFRKILAELRIFIR